MTTSSRISAGALFALVIAVSPAAAQDPGARVERLLNPRTTSFGMVGHYWTFADSLFEPVGSDLKIKRAAQVTIPVALSMPLGPRLLLDVTGAYAGGVVEVEAPDGSRAGYYAYGPSDVRLRLAGGIADDHIMIVTTINAPTGKTKLDQNELSALRILAAPALNLTPAQVGSGAGGSAGIVLNRQAGAFGLAVGASYEFRGKYSPVAAITAGAPPTDYDPGEAIHFTAGLDGRVGAHNMSLDLSADMYTDDEILASGEPLSTLKLGPTMGVFWQFDFATTRFRELAIFVSDRYRSSYERDGETVDGTSGNYIDVGIRSAYPMSQSVDFTTALELHQQSGLSVVQSIATAKATSAGASLGFAFRGSRFSFMPYLHGEIGSLDPGTGSVRMMGASLGLLFSTKR